ncbi:MAG: hypothetical protein CME59_00525 [Halioglobus sp.]|nr:hypothetical protein [Halioglobus sp.]|tara:strand:+ start:7895 stop:9244 length:1350 start_codon:yes stop_codon:yes gene_type:complete
MATRKKNGKGSDVLPRLMFVLSLCTLSAAGGMAIWATQTFPYALVNNAVSELEKWFPRHVLDEDERISRDLGESNLNEIRYHEYGVRLHDRQNTSPGATLLTSFWKESGWKPGVKLVDIDGNTLHRWDVSARSIWPLRDFPLGTYVHGAYLLPNGDIIANIEYAGLVRLNACSEVVWKSPFVSHHSVFRDHNGHFWVSGYRLIKEDNPRAGLFPPIKPPFAEELLIQVSADGRMVHMISLLKSLYNSPWRHLLWHYERIQGPAKLDILHLNDVESLSPELAQDFPTLDAGDIVFSSRSLNAIGILSPQGRVKWLLPGVFTLQHDPDFEAGGWITVFDNRDDWTRHKGDFLGGSRIRAVNPATNEVRDIYRSAPGRRFYTRAAGKHELLANGNRLITEAKAGRVFEISPQGRTVWEWIAEPYGKRGVFDVTEGSRYPAITREITDTWPCN